MKIVFQIVANIQKNTQYIYWKASNVHIKVDPCSSKQLLFKGQL